MKTRVLTRREGANGFVDWKLLSTTSENEFFGPYKVEMSPNPAQDNPIVYPTGLGGGPTHL